MVCFNVDNQQAVVAVSNRNWARDSHLAHLLRCLFFFEAHFKFQLMPRVLHSSTSCNRKVSTSLHYTPDRSRQLFSHGCNRCRLSSLRDYRFGFESSG